MHVGNRRTPRHWEVLTAAFVFLAATGCDSRPQETAATESESQGAATPVAEQEAATNSVHGRRVEVVLREFDIDMPDTLPPGPVTLRIENAGKSVHTVQLTRRGTDRTWSLEPNLQPGQRGELRLDLQPGEYQVTCPIADHAARGMQVRLTVEQRKRPAP